MSVKSKAKKHRREFEQAQRNERRAKVKKTPDLQMQRKPLSERRVGPLAGVPAAELQSRVARRYLNRQTA